LGRTLSSTTPGMAQPDVATILPPTISGVTLTALILSPGFESAVETCTVSLATIVGADVSIRAAAVKPATRHAAVAAAGEIDRRASTATL
jgi:hypothetical protein